MSLSHKHQHCDCDNALVLWGHLFVTSDGAALVEVYVTQSGDTVGEGGRGPESRDNLQHHLNAASPLLYDSALSRLARNAA